MVEQVAHEAGRKARARSERRHAIWFGLGMMGLIGWAVAVPTLAGVAIGLWLDVHWPQQFSWTITLIFVGVIVGCLNAWWWVRRESEKR